MYNDYSYKDYNFTLEELKRDTIYMCRKKNLTDSEYFMIFDLIYFPDTERKDLKYFFSCDDKKFLSFFRKFLHTLDGFDINIQDTSFLKEDEQSFYKLLPNDGDVLLSVIYYFHLEPNEQKIAFRHLVTQLIWEQLDILSVKQFKDDKDLLKTFEHLTDGRKKQVIDFVNFLYDEQIEQELRKQVRQERKIEDKLNRFKKEQ